MTHIELFAETLRGVAIVAGCAGVGLLFGVAVRGVVAVCRLARKCAR